MTLNKKREKKEFEEVTIDIARVMRVTKGGRQLRFRALVIIGDKNGQVGAGLGKAGEVSVAIQKAIASAKKNLIKVSLKGDTIPHEVNKKYKSALVRLLPASPGTGIIAGSAVRVICELAGIKNILAKSFGSNNKACLAEATLNALKDLRKFVPHNS
jgi:small subunit ribosomal protein S5